MKKQEENNPNKSEEIELSNVQKSVLDYYAEQLEKGGDIPKIDQTIAKMQLHVDLENLERDKARDKAKKELRDKAKKEVKTQEGREL